MSTTILLAHGGGGQLMEQLIAQSVLTRLGNPILSELADSGIMPMGEKPIALTIDGYVVQPWKFPGGDIGRLAVCGTVNDLAVCGARPIGLALGMILAEGLETKILDAVMESVAAAAAEAGVSIVTGDTKVVGRGQADGIYLTTAGVGLIETERPALNRVQPGDVLLINGPIADHGLAVMLAREMPELASNIQSDAAPLNGLIAQLLKEVPQTAFLRDPTRGGLAGLCADLAKGSGLHVSLDEEAIAVRPATRHAAEMLGIDPLEVANEGKVVAAVPAQFAERALKAMREHKYGQEARVIGRVEEVRDGICELRTLIGGRRILQKPFGEQLPRIC